mmetsp:Transcript_90614/g.261093  ORF Transcript_90614/g.261093 Transcript_90614/m.261093 type:complete len:256 (-) Transcript_90614:89-856(-)
MPSARAASPGRSSRSWCRRTSCRSSSPPAQPATSSRPSWETSSQAVYEGSTTHCWKGSGRLTPSTPMPAGSWPFPALTPRRPRARSPRPRSSWSSRRRSCSSNSSSSSGTNGTCSRATSQLMLLPQPPRRAGRWTAPPPAPAPPPPHTTAAPGCSGASASGSLLRSSLPPRRATRADRRRWSPCPGRRGRQSWFRRRRPYRRRGCSCPSCSRRTHTCGSNFSNGSGTCPGWTTSSAPTRAPCGPCSTVATRPRPC